MKRWIEALCVSSMVAGIASAGEWHPESSDEAQRSLATFANWGLGIYEAGTNDGKGSGFLFELGDGLYFGTAKHVADDGISYEVRTGTDTMNDPWDIVSVTDWYFHPERDFAIGRLASAITSVDGMALYDGSIAEGMEGTFVGFGRKNWYDPWDGIRRGGILDVTHIVGEYQYESWFTDQGDPYYHLRDLAGRHGDSGALMGYFENDIFYGDGIAFSASNFVTDFQRLDHVFINSVIPEPSTLSLLVLGAVAVCRRTRAATRQQVRC